MAKVEKQVLHHCFAQAKEQYKLGNKDKSRDYADMGIAYVAEKRIEGYGAKDTIEDIRVEMEPKIEGRQAFLVVAPK